MKKGCVSMVRATNAEQSGTQFDWGPDSWRARAVWHFNWGTVALTTLPVLFAIWQGYSLGGFFVVLLAVLLALTTFGFRYPRMRAIAIAFFWYSVGILTLHDAGFSVPTGALSLAIATALLGLLWDVRGLIVGIAILFVIVVGIGANIFFFGILDPFTANRELWLATPENYVRSSIFTIVQVLVLSLSVSYIARQQNKALDALKRENAERERAELAFREAQRSELVTRLTSALAHNFGNALTVITTWTELLQRYPDRRDYVERGVKDMSEASRQATQLSKQVMSLSRLHVHHAEIVDPAEVLSSQIGLLRTLVPATIDLRAELPGGHHVRADPSELQQALLNLVLNARDAIDGKGYIAVSIVRRGDDVVLEVEDSGAGIDPMILDRIFEPFFSTKGAEGTGLGLASVKQSVENAGGRIDVESHPGSGSTFRLIFEAVDHAPSVIPDDGAGAYAAQKAARIVVADDEEIVLRALVTSLEEAGHSVFAAQNVADAIALVEREDDVDLLVTDAIMPGGIVTELIEAFRARFAEAPVLVCSGYVEEDVLARNLKAGEFAFLQKPVSSSMLRVKVRELLED
jgi:signal transduction histidine kinase